MTSEQHPVATADDLLALAEELAVSAGRLAHDGRRGLGLGQIAAHETKSSPTDPVTEFDVAAEQLIVEALRSRRPADAIVGEEGANHAGTSGLAWHVDPIDGTANFVYDLPAWCTSVAVVDGAGSLAGAVYAPVTDELFSARRGTGAQRNGVPITCSATGELDRALVASGFSYSVERRRLQARRLATLIPQVRDLRRFGSAALDLCMVGCGRLDAYFEEHLNSWDLAAGLLVATEAGAVATDFAGGDVRPESAVVAAPGIHRALLELLAPTAS